MMGDVPHGVMLNNSPIFLGGQGGIVGPLRLAFGTITAAGTIYRKDELRTDRLLLTGFPKDINIPFSRGRIQNIKRIVQNNLIYIANLVALKHWYGKIRMEFLSEIFPLALLEGLQDKLDMNIHERLDRLKELIHIALQGNSDDTRCNELFRNWSELDSVIRNHQVHLAEDQMVPPVFLESIRKGIKEWGRDYIQVIQKLNPDDAGIGSKWLRQIVNRLLAEVFERIPSFGFSEEIMGQGTNG
jgi:UDP-N-acetylglucosamine/UDP-N-acetylgalactosamine diphosphorylase